MKKYLIYDILTICWREYRHFLKNKAILTMGIIQPILWFLLLGFGMNGFVGKSSELSVVMGTQNYLTYIMPGIIIMTALSGGLFPGAGFVGDISSNYINKMLSSPISRSSIIFGRLLYSILQTFTQVIVVMIFSLCFGVRFSINVYTFIAILFALVFSIEMSAIGIITAVKLKSHQAVYSFLGMLNIPLIFTSSAFFPSETMPLVMKLVSYLNPLTYAISVVRSMLFSIDNNFALYVLILCLQAVVLIFIATKMFNKEYNKI